MVLSMPVGEKTEPGSQMPTTLYSQRRKKRRMHLCMRVCARVCVHVYMRERHNTGKEDFFLSSNSEI